MKRNARGLIILVSLIVLSLVLCKFFGDGAFLAGSDGGTQKEPGPMDAAGGAVPAGGGTGIYTMLGSDAGSLRIDLFCKEGKACIFLPSFAMSGSLSLYYDGSGSVTLDKAAFESGKEFAVADLEGAELEAGGQSYELCVMRSENIPAVFIDTEGKDMSAIDADKTVVDKGLWRGIAADGSVDYSGTFDSINSRGNSSFEAAKKSYRVKLSQKADIFGMGADRSWILQANAYDNTNIRNSLAYTLADSWGMEYTPQFRPADVYLNGMYNGSYIVLEPVKVGPGHVDIAGDDSYFFEVVHDEKRLDPEAFSFMCGNEIHLQLLYPEKPDRSDKEYADKHMNRIDDMISSLGQDDGIDELLEYIEPVSFAGMFLFNFVTNDIDAGNYSSYAYIDGRDHLVHLGPVWDYDKAWGNEKKKNAPVDFNAYSYRWPEQLSDNREFGRIIDSVFEEVSPHIDGMLEHGIDELAQEIGSSWEMDNIRYGNLSSQSIDEGSLEANLAQLKAYMRGRYELLKEIRAGADYHRVYIKGPSGKLFWVRKGERLSAEDIDFLKKLYGCDGFLTGDGEVFNENSDITADMTVLPD